jgi:hypothetical protein
MDKTDQFSPPLVDILNKRMGLRDPVFLPLQQRLAPTSQSTRQTLLTSQFDRNPVLLNAKPDDENTKDVSSVVDTESALQNRFFALQKADQAFYVPSSQSSLFAGNDTTVLADRTSSTTFTSSLLSDTSVSHRGSSGNHPNISGLDAKAFGNSTRARLGAGSNF